MKTRMLVVGVALAALAAAADVTGKWKATFSTPDGSTRENTLTFKAEGEKLTGAVASQMGEAAIEDGKVKGDEITFAVTRNFGGNEVKLMYKGKVSGDEIKFMVSFGDREFEMSAKRIPT